MSDKACLYHVRCGKSFKFCLVQVRAGKVRLGHVRPGYVRLCLFGTGK
jgi:hypothetical protein